MDNLNDYRVNKLKCSGYPINTILQLYQHADIIDLLFQKKSFIDFAFTHLNLDREIDSVLINLLKKACLGAENKNVSFEELKNLSDRAAIYAKKVGKHCEDLENTEERNRLIIAVAAIMMLSGIDLQDKLPAPKTLLAAFRGNAINIQEAEDNEIFFGKNKIIVLTTQKIKYAFDYNPTYKLKSNENEEIVTYCITVQKNGPKSNVDIVFSADSEKNEIRTINENEKLYVNVVGNTVVAVLPTKTEHGENAAVRNLAGFICVNGKPQDNSQGATSFDISPNGECLWVRDGKLGGPFRYKTLLRVSYADEDNFVEVCFKNNKYYLLTSNGHIWSNDNLLDNSDAAYFNASLFRIHGGTQ